MHPRSSSDFGYVVTMLANRLRPEAWNGERIRPFEAKKERQVVFLLGAGCSRQYGLPSFRELLTYLWQDCYHERPDSSWSFETLRDRLDQYWRTLGPEDRKRTLVRYLRRIPGDGCPAYRRLASLASYGHIKAIINMNFDTLLEEALAAESIPYRVSTSFKDRSENHLMVYKPHGSIPPQEPAGLNDESVLWSGEDPKAGVCSDLILDIANSDLFSRPQEQGDAQQLLTNYDVVSVGYSGVDAKIAAALRASDKDKDPRDKKIFVINFDRPDPRLLLVMGERASQDLLVTGEDGGFENFMEHLELAVEHPKSFDTVPVPMASEEPTFMTRSERVALAECLRLALSIRAGINVADRSSMTIERHGHDIYRLCLELANAGGDCLTPPEKFLLHAAAFFHDLGYFAAYSGGSVLEYPGWRLLNRHGFKTRELMDKKLEIERNAKIIPATYSNHEALTIDLLDICQYHATYEEETIDIADDHKVRVSGREVRVRPRLLQALFAAAEDLAMEHPFLPSPDPVVAGHESRWIVEDPVLDLFLRRKKDEVVFSLERGRVIGRTREGQFSKKALWLLNMASRFVNRYAAHSEGWGIRFVCDPPRRILGPGADIRISELLAVALEEELAESLLRVETDIQSEVVNILDGARQHLNAVASELSETLPESFAIPELAKQAIEAAQRSISREWIADLRANARMVEAVLARQVLDHQEIFRTPFGEISKLDREVRKLLRKNIPELSWGDILIRLAALESAIWETMDLGEPTLAELASLTEKLEDVAASLQEDAQQPSILALKESLTALAAGFLSVGTLLVADGLALIASSLAGMRHQVREGLTAPAMTSIASDLDSMVAYMQRLRDSKWPLEGVDALFQILVQVQRKLMWMGPDAKPELLTVDLESAESSLASLQLMAGRLERSELRKRLRESQRELEGVRKRVEEMTVVNALAGLRHTESLLAQLQKGNGRALPGRVSDELAAALALLAKARNNLTAPPTSYIASVLDLLVIYTLGGEDPVEGEETEKVLQLEFDEPEPRVPLDNRTVAQALAWIKRTGQHPHSILLDSYFRIAASRRDPAGFMEREFKKSFDRILYPAWRFFGRNLHDGIETTLMAVACFDLGSSRFRDEAVSGIRHLLGDKMVTRDGQWAYGHHECTLCTSRLLYILSHARRLFPRDELDGFAQVPGQGIDRTVGGLLRYFLDRSSEDEAWWGLGCTAHGSRIKSADYLAWAARAITFCLTVDREIADRTGESWLAESCGLKDRDDLLRLLEQRWAGLFDVKEEQLLDLRAEEPHSLILGGIAVACLDLQRYGVCIERFSLEKFRDGLSSMADKLARTILAIGNLSQLSRFFIWPVRLLQDSVGHRLGSECPDGQAVEICRECADSPIWIQEGPDAGSWGFNVKNTQAIVSSLVEFWRYVLEDEDRRQRFSRLFEGEAGAPGVAPEAGVTLGVPSGSLARNRPGGRKKRVASQPLPS